MVFQPGNTFGKGRPVGARVKLAEDFIRDLASEWETRGKVALTQLSPDKLVDAALKLLPKDVNVNHEITLSDDELDAEIAKLHDIITGAAKRKADAARESGARRERRSDSVVPNGGLRASAAPPLADRKANGTRGG